MSPPASDSTGLLTKAQLKNLDSHKYSSAGKSLAEYPLQVFWNWLVKFVPEWIAPNTLTISGLCVNTLSTLILFAYCPHATEEAPSWVYFNCAISFFVYQALDAIDGKHARRISCQSPLGELFDHGCDAVSLAFVGLAVPCAMQLGNHPHYLFLYYSATLVVFYCAHWRTYICGTLEFAMVDVTEAQLGMMVVHLMSAVYGPAFWRTVLVESIGLDIQLLLLVVTVVAVSLSLINSVEVVFRGGQGKNGSTIADTSVLSPAIPVAIVAFLSHYIYRASPARIMQTEPVLTGLLLGFVSAKLCINLVIAHMSKSAMILIDNILLAPLLLFLNIYIGALLPEFMCFVVATLYAGFNLCTMSTLVCQQICEHLNIYCFSVEKRAEPH